jgi:glycosyltransferase involved in cell wall biosynthesis
MTVSVIMPAFNYARYISESLESLRAQTFADWECIVVDDGSTDDTANVVQKIVANDARIRYIHQANRGQPAARNNAFRNSRGKYFQFLDADDLLESQKFERQVAYLESHPDVDLVYGEARYFRTENPGERRFALTDDRPWMPNISGRGKEITLALVRANIMAIECPLFRRRVIDDVGLMDESLVRADDFFLRCAISGKHFQYEPMPGTMSLVRSHPVSLTKRNRNLIESSLVIHRKAATIVRDDEVKAANDSIVAWLEQVLHVTQMIDTHIPREERFVLIDEDQLRGEMLGYPAIPFTQLNGEYWGPPESDDAALRELEDRCGEGVRFVVIAAKAFWWLEHYPKFAAHIGERADRLFSDDALMIYRFK